MKIAHLCPYDWNAPGGVREHVRHLAAQHHLLGHEVTVLAPRGRSAADDTQATLIPTTLIGVPGARATARIAVDPRIWQQIGNHLRNGSFDLVHLHEPLVPLVCAAALRQADCPIVGTIHGYRPSYWLYGALRPWIDPQMNRLAARIAVSSDARAWVDQYFAGHYHVIPDGVDVRRFSSASPLEASDDTRPIILFVGRPDPRKGFAVLANAFTRLRRDGVEARLVVVGGFTPAQVKSWRQRVGADIADDIEFVGRVSDTELPRYFRSADVYCSPATGYEALGIVLLEAMAAGTPIVASDIVGYRTVVRDQVDGFLVRPHDPKALAEALTAVLDDPALRSRLVVNGSRRVRHYDWPVVARRVLGVYDEVLGGIGHGPDGTAIDAVMQIARELFGIELPTDEATRPLQEVGIDSLDLAELAVALESRTSVQIDDGDLRSVRSFADLARIVTAGGPDGADVG